MSRKLPSQTLSQREKVLWLKERTQQSSTGCWVWLNGLHSQGYGRVSKWLHDSQMAHRAMYSMAVGPIPHGMFVLHECDNRKCINPEHLWVGSHIENVNDMLSKHRNIRHKLSDLNVQEIKRFRTYGLSLREISSAFGISPTWAMKITRGDAHA